MILKAEIPMSRADLDRLTEADLRWLEREVSRRLAERLSEGPPAPVSGRFPDHGKPRKPVRS